MVHLNGVYFALRSMFCHHFLGVLKSIFSYTLKSHSHLDPGTILDVTNENKHNELDILFGHLSGCFLFKDFFSS